MATNMPDVAPTRASLLRAYHEDLAARIDEATQKVGQQILAVPTAFDVVAWEGVPVVTRRDLDEIVGAVFAQPLPAPSENTAEVSTPAIVIVWAVCPRCAISQPIAVTIHPELLVDDDGAELRIKAKAKARTHI